MADKVLKTIEAIEEFQEKLDNKNTLMFTNSVLVKKSEFVELLETIKYNLPDEVMKCQAFMDDMSAIHLRAQAAAKSCIDDAEKRANDMLEDAKRKAEEIVSMANQKRNELLDQNQIVIRAKEYAQSLQARSESQAREIIENAKGIAMSSLNSTMNELDQAKNRLRQYMSNIERLQK